MTANLSLVAAGPRLLGLVLLMMAGGACGKADGGQSAGVDAAASARRAPAPAADPGQARVRGVAGHYDLGDYFLTGEVVNGLDVPIYDVELDVGYRGAGGAVLASDEAAAVLTRVEPGGTAPFADTHYAAPQGIERAVVTVRRFSRDARLDYRPLAITGVQSRAGITGAVVTGQARNDAGVPLTSVKLVASFRNGAGEVTGVFFDYPVIGSLAPGQTVEFTIETLDDSVADDRVTVQGEGHAQR